MGQTVVVTGGDGFIGSYVMKGLEEYGYDALSFDRAVGLDVTNKEQVFEELEYADHVIHLAGVLGTSELFDDPQHAVEVNVNGTLNVLQACAEFQVGYVGITMPQVWDNIYQATKLAAMKLASAYHRHFGVPVCHVRAFNVFGENQKIHGVQKIIPTFSSLAWQGKPIPVWGTGRQSVDLIYVADVARVLIDVMGFGDQEIFDAGTGESHTVFNVANYVNRQTHNAAEIDFRPMRKGEHGHGVVAAGEGWSRLGWYPKFSWVKLRETIEWYKGKV